MFPQSIQLIQQIRAFNRTLFKLFKTNFRNTFLRLNLNSLRYDAVTNIDDIVRTI